MALFGLPTPEQVRQNIRRDIFNNGRLFQGPMGGAQQGAHALGSALGMGINRLFGNQSPDIARAEKIQQIFQGIQSELGEPDSPQGIYDMGQMYAQRLMEAGEPDLAFKVMGQIKGMSPGTSDRDMEFWKEERKSASQTVKGLSSRAASLRSDYGKLQQLSQRARGKGTSARAARNSMIANIVRLNSPGIVSEQELKTYTGGQDTTAAMLTYLQGKGVDTSAIMANIDPSGETFDVDGMLGLGQDLILGQAAPIFDQYEDAKNRATQAGISDRAFSSIFGKNKNLDALRELAVPSKQKPQKVQVVDW